jgi:hypothetical protein
MCSKLNLPTEGFISRFNFEHVGYQTVAREETDCLRRGLTKVPDSRMSFARPLTVMQIRSVLRNLHLVLETVSHNMDSPFDPAF